MNGKEQDSLLFDLDKVGYQFLGEVRIEITGARIRKGDRFLISGPSGCGKSTVLGLLSLALKPSYGKRFLFQRKNIFALWKNHQEGQLARLRGLYFGFVSQTASLIPFLTVRENIELPQNMIGRKDGIWLNRLVERLEIDRILFRRPHEISVGQRQRVAVARALINRPMIIMADEPTASVHPALADGILNLLIDTVKETGASLIMTSHDTHRVLSHGLREIRCHVDPDRQQTRLQIDA